MKIGFRCGDQTKSAVDLFNLIPKRSLYLIVVTQTCVDSFCATSIINDSFYNSTEKRHRELKLDTFDRTPEHSQSAD